jgi:hypothetical protein
VTGIHLAQVDDLLGWVLQVGIERHHAVGAAVLESGDDRKVLAEVAIGTTRVTSGRRANCSRSIAGDRSRLPSLTKDS